ncbi:hypothetical protein Q0Z83_015890 [Actinoplanes sichuanensis]|uniref:Phosphotransferase n=1 Tax=Actinoplanes sichuanensis TaxID=512349 RepID=A0ABW4A6U3_9ACTN|nr:phosphotransferase [Actinoplanes sichuanensis]BEL03398.1 hypothetical protein Q0Z83_015890 [Actinoplanes sichuanensis]
MSGALWVDGPLGRREFRLVRRVRSGGEGEVWQAERTDNDVTARWAVKILLPERIAPDRNPRRVLNEWMRRWQQTMMRVGALNLPGVVFPAGVFTGPRPYTGGGPDDSAGRALYMVSRWVDGGQDLDRWRTGHFEVAACRGLLDQICTLVESLGDEGMVHGDLTPGNIMVEHGEVRLIDFTRLTHTDATPVLPGGTRGYMAPELSRPGVRVDPAIDRYAVGTVAYFLLAGVDPAHQDAARTVRRQLPRYGYPQALADHVAALLDPRPEQRPRLSAWARDLGRLIGGAYHSDGFEELALTVDATGTTQIAAAGGRRIAVAQAGSRHQPLLDHLPLPAPQGVRAIALARRGNGDVAVFARGNDRSVTVRVDGTWRVLPGVTAHGPLRAATRADGGVSAYLAGATGLTVLTVGLDGEPTVEHLTESARRVLAVASGPAGDVHLAVEDHTGQVRCGPVGGLRPAGLADVDTAALCVNNHDEPVLIAAQVGAAELTEITDPASADRAGRRPLPGRPGIRDVSCLCLRTGLLLAVAADSGLWVRPERGDWTCLWPEPVQQVAAVQGYGWRVQLVALAEGRVLFAEEDAPDRWPPRAHFLKSPGD